jgi:hypothetical protein
MKAGSLDMEVDLENLRFKEKTHIHVIGRQQKIIQYVDAF